MKALLALENGFTLEGESFTGEFETGGEVIFNTGMTGYQEILTDPSYCGQLVCLTYPLIGNYGINPDDMESEKVHMSALIVKECCKEPSNWRSFMSLPDFMKEQGVPGMEGLDTRALTIQLRSKGSMRCMISTRDLDPESLTAKARALPGMEGQNLVPFVAAKAPYVFLRNAVQTVSADKNGRLPFVGSGLRLVVYDYGIKWNIIRLLKETGFSPVMVPPLFPAEAVRRSGAQGVFLSNGPGDPEPLKGVQEVARQIIEENLPLFGICLGHQIIALSQGIGTYKMHNGHRGINHPVMNLETGRGEITSQNHGFVVCREQAEASDRIIITHEHLNDHTVAGIRVKGKKCFSVQYHPESAPGPQDSRYLFEQFVRSMADAKEVSRNA